MTEKTRTIPKTKKKKWPRKTLGELLNFLEQFYPEGLSLEDLARDLGTTRGGVSNMFRHDDMKLSKAEEIANIYGYTLHLYFPIRQYNDGYIPQPPKRHYPNAGNLTGFVKYIQDSEYSLTFIAEKNQMSVTTLTRAFTTGNIQLSTLYNLTDWMGICFIWKFEKQKEN